MKTIEPKWRIRLRHRATRALYAVLAFLSVAALVGCAWARATFADPPGPIRCDPARCDGTCSDGMCTPLPPGTYTGGARDAG